MDLSNLSDGLQSMSFYSRANAKASPKELAAKFEAIFYRILLKQARQAELGDSILESRESRQYQEMRDDELSLQMGKKGHLGIVNLVMDFVKKTQSEKTIPLERFSEVFGQRGKSDE